MDNTTATESTETATARAQGIAIANDRCWTKDQLIAMATYGFKGSTGYPEGSDLHFVVLCAANDEAKRLTAGF